MSKQVVSFGQDNELGCLVVRYRDGSVARAIAVNGKPVAVPAGAVAYKYADPIEDARWLYSDAEADEIASEDPSLIVRA